MNYSVIYEFVLLITKYIHYPIRIAKLQAMSGKGQEIPVHWGFDPVDTAKHKHYSIRRAKTKLCPRGVESPTHQEPGPVDS